MIAVPSAGIHNPCRESFEGAWGDFFKSPPKKKLFQKFSPENPTPTPFFQKSFAIHVKAAVTAGAVDGMMPGSARKAERAFAMGALAIDVGLAVSPLAVLE